MDIKTVESKYARNAIKPTEVYTNETADANVTFNLTLRTLDEVNMRSYASSSVKQLSTLGGIRLIKDEIKNINGKRIAIIEFYSNAIDGAVYNLMFIASVNRKAMLGSFNCTANELPHWQLIAREIVNSIKFNN